MKTKLTKRQGNSDKAINVKRKDVKKDFAEGRYSTIHETKVALEGDQKQREISLVVKKYRDGPHFDGNSDEVDTSAEMVFRKYDICKKAGLKVPPTFRLDLANDSIVMTNYNKGGNIALASNPNKKAEGWITNTKIEDIENLEALLVGLRKQCELAARNHIKLAEDSFFLIFPAKGGVVNADFVISDLDHVEISQTEANMLLRFNLHSAESFLYCINRDYGNPQLRERLNSFESILN
ncbi:hypothetical protein A3A38_02715 [Candidatus Kaiserbacteria bacterium RIFCSPLOWO2_01_FULL_53_17]|uniref:Uncharacterized protein n=1 Tax=Candidatus Kaiserbacteria bacterium RIFCSPLOWO2_01_FULL_53_17 TaxID=1798511 RepID=A0A1F6EGX5_9BACT|nr:MAG: hypothetical protein A3A38_02715 [Candidatus Kaiserbacteria bacterium RIFCSPLOWO2_01_FULL_53_17]